MVSVLLCVCLFMFVDLYPFPVFLLQIYSLHFVCKYRVLKIWPTYFINYLWQWQKLYSLDVLCVLKVLERLLLECILPFMPDFLSLSSSYDELCESTGFILGERTPFEDITSRTTFTVSYLRLLRVFLSRG